MKKGTRFITEAAVIAAIYIVLTMVFSFMSFGQMQVRVSEALCVLPFFTPAAVPGLFIGCLVSNILGSNLGLMDVVVGSLATLAAAFLASRIKIKWLAPLPAVAINMFAVAWVLNTALGLPYWVSAGWVGLGQAIACYGIGMPLLLILDKNRKAVFGR